MSGDVCVTLFETVVLSNVMKIISTDDNGSCHLVGNNNTSENTSTDGNVSGEGALLIDVGALDGVLGCLEAKSDISPISGLSLYLAAQSSGLLGKEDSGLLLESLFGLSSSISHGCLMC